MCRFLLLMCIFLAIVIASVQGYICMCGCCNSGSSGCVFNSNNTVCSSTCAATCQAGCPTACSASTGTIYCANSVNSQSTANNLCAAVSTSTNSSSTSGVTSISNTFSGLSLLSAAFVYILFG